MLTNFLPTPTKVSEENVGGQIQPSFTSYPTEQTVEPIQPPYTPTTIPTSTVENITPDIPVEEINPCSLITAEEAEQVLGETVTPPQEMNGACAYNNAKDSLYVISVSAAQEEQTEGILQGQAMLLGMAGVPLDQAKLDQLKSLAIEQDYLAYFTELENLGQGVPSIKAHILEGIPDLEYWVWLEAESRRQGDLVLVRNQSVLNINLIIPDSHSEPATLEVLQDLAEKIFQRLPQRFSIAMTSTATPTNIGISSPLVPTSTSTPWEPTFTSTPWISVTSPSIGYVEQSSYTGDCSKRPANSVCVRYEDGYVWLIFSDSITGWEKIGNWQGKIIQVAYGLHADYYHVLGTSLIMTVAK
jgi:hypothetical protein